MENNNVFFLNISLYFNIVVYVMDRVCINFLLSGLGFSVHFIFYIISDILYISLVKKLMVVNSD